MKRSQLNPKPIILTPIEACAFIGKAIKEYRQNNPKRWKQLAHREDWAKYWKDKHEACLNELKKEASRWWRFL